MLLKEMYLSPKVAIMHINALGVLCASQQINNTIYFVDMKEAEYGDLWED